MLDVLKVKNPHVTMFSIYDQEFSRYGEVFSERSQFTTSIEYLKNTSMPAEGNQYQAHDENFMKCATHIDLVHDVFGDIPLEYGYVNGHNSKLNALEFHKSSELNIAVTPMVLLLAHVDDIKNDQIHSDQVVAFYIPENTVFEVYSTTLHFSPCKVTDEGFRCGVILPFGTNVEFITSKTQQGRFGKFLFKTNKWLLSHPENERMLQLGAVIGITGENIEIKY